MNRVSLFNDEIEHYTNESNVKYTILALTILAGIVGIMWVMGEMTLVAEYMIDVIK